METPPQAPDVFVFAHDPALLRELLPLLPTALPRAPDGRLLLDNKSGNVSKAPAPALLI